MQALGFQFPWTTIFRFCAQRLWETITNNFLVPWKFMGTLFFLRGGANQGDGRPNETRGASLKGEWGGGGTRLSETAWTWFLLFITLRVGKKLLSHLIAYWAPLNNHQKESGNTCGRNNNLLSYYVLDVMVQHRFSANKINRKAREKKATVVWEWINDQQGKCFDLKTNLLTTNSWRKGREVSLCICISGIGGVRRMR